MSQAQRFGLFNLIGLGGFVLQLALIGVLTRVFGWHYALATVVAVQAAIVQNYFGDTRWTWADRPVATARQRLMRAMRYQTVRTVTLALNVLLTAGFVSGGGLPPEIANVLAVGCCAIVNYACADRYVFAA